MQRSFGSNLRRLRLAQGLKSKQLAEKLGVKPSVVSAWERDRGGLPESSTLLRVAKALGCTVEDLLEGVDRDYDRAVTLRAAEFGRRLRLIQERLLPQMTLAVERGELAPEIAEGIGQVVMAALSLLQQNISLRRAAGATAVAVNGTVELMDEADRADDAEKGASREDRLLLPQGFTDLDIFYGLFRVWRKLGTSAARDLFVREAERYADAIAEGRDATGTLGKE